MSSGGSRQLGECRHFNTADRCNECRIEELEFLLRNQKGQQMDGQKFEENMKAIMTGELPPPSLALPSDEQRMQHSCADEPVSGESLAVMFHDTYERLAPQFGYETRPETRQFDPNSPNGRLMIAVCTEIIRSKIMDGMLNPGCDVFDRPEMPGKGRMGTAGIAFTEKPHDDEQPDELSVDLISH
jgi:hypothetical protein